VRGSGFKPTGATGGASDASAPSAAPAVGAARN
jgi:hypothetical protein